MLGGETVWPENLNSAEVALNVDVIAVTGEPYTSVLPATDVVHRVDNLFSFYVTGGFSTGDLSLLENLLAWEFKQEFPGTIFILYAQTERAHIFYRSCSFNNSKHM